MKFGVWSVECLKLRETDHFTHHSLFKIVLLLIIGNKSYFGNIMQLNSKFEARNVKQI